MTVQSNMIFVFLFYTSSARSLKVQIPMSEVIDKMVQNYVESVSNNSVLDISYCFEEQIQRTLNLWNQCKSLTCMKRNMPSPEWERGAPGSASCRVDREAMIIANTMTGFHQLELCFGGFGDSGLMLSLPNLRNSPILISVGVGGGS